jgi:hypothetical protein
MTPAAFLALTRTAADATDGRTYRAMTEGSNETFLTLHLSNGQCHSLAYSQLALITGDERGGTFIRLAFRLHLIIQGQQLQHAIEAIRVKKAAHLYEFNDERYDPPEPGEAVITQIEFQKPRTG